MKITPLPYILFNLISFLASEVAAVRPTQEQPKCNGTLFGIPNPAFCLQQLLDLIESRDNIEHLWISPSLPRPEYATASQWGNKIVLPDLSVDGGGELFIASTYS